jgi:hypothetical protein
MDKGHQKRSAGGPPAGVPASKRSGGLDDNPDLDALIDEQFANEDVDDFDPDCIEEGPDIDLGEAGRNWMRPPVAADFNPSTTNLGTPCSSVHWLQRTCAASSRTAC